MIFKMSLGPFLNFAGRVHFDVSPSYLTSWTTFAFLKGEYMGFWNRYDFYDGQNCKFISFDTPGWFLGALPVLCASLHDLAAVSNQCEIFHQNCNPAGVMSCGCLDAYSVPIAFAPNLSQGQVVDFELWWMIWSTWQQWRLENGELGLPWDVLVWKLKADLLGVT